MTMLIALTGPKGSGKDTAGDALEGEGWRRLKFAGPLKVMLGALLRAQGIDEATAREMIDGQWKEVQSFYLQNQTPRYAMQTLGTEWGRNLMGSSLWTQALENSYRAETTPAFVTDLRFENEAEVIRRLGGKIIRIERPGLGVNTFSAHQSETEMLSIKADAKIVNSGSIHELRDKLLATVNLFMYSVGK